MSSRTLERFTSHPMYHPRHCVLLDSSPCRSSRCWVCLPSCTCKVRSCQPCPCTLMIVPVQWVMTKSCNGGCCMHTKSANAVDAHYSAVTLGWFLPPRIKDLNMTELPPGGLREPTGCPTLPLLSPETIVGPRLKL